MIYTADKVKEEITPEIRSKMIQALLNDKEFSSYFSMPQMRELWVAGCWLNNKLESSGIAKNKADEIAFEHGRISFGRCPYEMAARQINKYLFGEKRTFW